MQHEVIKTKITMAGIIYSISLCVCVCVYVYIYILGSAPKMRHACEKRAMATHTHTGEGGANPSIST